MKSHKDVNICKGRVAMRLRERKSYKSLIFYIFGAVGVIAFNIVAWLSSDFCDWYREHIFPVWLNTFARITSAVHFSVGEIMLVFAVAITLSGMLFFIVNLIMRGKFSTAIRRFGKAYAWLVLTVCYIMTFNCFILYHATGFTENYVVNANSPETMVVDISDDAVAQALQTQISGEHNIYTRKNLTILRNYIVEKCNTLSEQIERDEDGNIVYEKDIIEESVKAMEKMGEKYDQLSGFYVSPKYLSRSGFFSQQYIMGYYFPFSLEANINSVMYVTNVAPTVCHELAHTKGFMDEKDANLIGYLACINSDDTFLQYCGYLSVLNYVNNDFYETIGKDKEVYKKNVRISDCVADDNIFLTKENWQAVEKKAVVKTSTVKKVSATLMETSLKMNGVEEGMKSYNEVVSLLIDYYDGVLY